MDPNLVTPPVSPMKPIHLNTTPIKTGSRTLHRFGDRYTPAQDHYLELGREMSPYFLGPMPAEAFLSTFFPPSKLLSTERMPSFTKNMFINVVDGENEKAMYGSFLAALNPHLSNLEICCTANIAEQTKTNFSFKIKPDCSVFPKGRQFLGTNSSTVQLLIEFKRYQEDDPFIKDPPPLMSNLSTSDDTKPSPPRNAFVKISNTSHFTCGQITTYATSHLSAQYQTHVFLVFICSDYARLIRWDRSGAIVTEPILYNEVSHMFDFFIRFDRSPPHVRGQDPTVSPANPIHTNDAINTVKQLKEIHQEQTPLLVVSVPNATTGKCLQYVIAPPLASPWLPVGRWTRTSIGYDIERKRAIFLKDSWRPVVNGALKEGDVYSIFKAKGVPNVPHCSSAGDIGDDEYHLTQTNHFFGADWVSNNVYDLPAHRHYRLVLDDIGQPLERFKCSREMVRAVHAALEAHDAVHKCRILHRDISPRNILISTDEKFHGGLLIDWDLCKGINSQVEKPRRATRTGTWQFMAADLVADPSVTHTFVHDLESAFYVVFWLSIKYLSNSWSPQRRATVMHHLFNPPVSQVGTPSKKGWMARAGNEVIDFEITGNPALTGLIKTLIPLFQARHMALPNSQPATEYNFSTRPHQSLQNETAIKGYLDELRDHEEVLNIFRNSLEPTWPTDEPATKQDMPPYEISIRYKSTKSKSLAGKNSSSKRLRLE